MRIVVDASVALKWVLDEAGSEAAGALLAEDLIAPELWLLEAANALWRRGQRGELSSDAVRERLAVLRQAPISSTRIEEDLVVAADLAIRLRHPVYDCLYLALAIRERTWVVTADRRFHGVAAGAGDLANKVRMLV